MKSFINYNDEILARQVARLPDSFEKPFDILGYFFAPPAWMFYLAVYALLAHTSNAFYIVALLPLAGLIKYLFRRKRPPTIYAGGMRIKSYSFPSSHAYSAALAAGYLAIIYCDRLFISLPLLSLLIIMGVSRIKLGAHYPSDVLAGWVLGFAVALLVTITA